MRLARDEIGGDVPLRLDHAAEIAFPNGAMTGKGLRREGLRGRLAIMRINGKLFTTLADIREMMRLCLDAQKDHDSGRNPSGGAAHMSSAPSGSSSTMEDANAALDAALRNAKRLKQSLPSTSTRSASNTARNSSRRTA
jgi:hypothetical protein